MNRWIRIIGTLTGFIALSIACSEPQPGSNPAAQTDSARTPDSEFYGATHYIYKKGRVTAKMIADSTHTFDAADSTVAWAIELFFYDSTGQTTATMVADSGLIKKDAGIYTVYGNLSADFFDSAGVNTSNLVGDSGVIHEHTGIMHIYENVVVTNESDRKVETDYLRWNSADDIINTDAFVKFTRGNGDVITTYGMVADRGLTRVRLLNQVSGTVIRTEEANQAVDTTDREQ